MGIESPVHLLFIAAVALIVLGPKRLPGLARALGEGIREFRGALERAQESDDEDEQPEPPEPPAAAEHARELEPPAVEHAQEQPADVLAPAASEAAEGGRPLEDSPPR